MRKLRGPLPFHPSTSFTWSHEIPLLAHQQELLDKLLALDLEVHKHNSEPYQGHERAALLHKYPGHLWNDIPSLQVWVIKPYFVREAIRNMRTEGRDFEYVLWIDAGSMCEKHGYRQ